MPDVFLNQSGESNKANKKNRHPESDDSGCLFSKALSLLPVLPTPGAAFAAAFAIAAAAAVAAGAAPGHDHQQSYEQNNQYVQKIHIIIAPTL